MRQALGSECPLDLALELPLTLASAGLQGAEDQVGGCQWSEVTGSKA